MERNRRNFLLILALALTLTIVVVSLQPARAATITVNTTSDEINDNEDCSLREAIQAANTNADVDACPAGSSSETDTITFAAATDGIPIILAGPAAENANGGGDLDVLDGGDLVIQGNGIDNTIIDGDGIDRVFHICPGGSCDSQVTISGITIQNGIVTISGGGGLRNDGGTTTLDASAILTSIAVNGGGIANFATLKLQNGTHIGEPGAGNWAYIGNGGGIYNYAGTTTIDASSVISNTAANNGGGIWNQVTLNVQNGSLIGGNVAEGTDAEDGGGGIYNFAGTTTVDGSEVNSNTARRGGGLYNYLDSSTTVNSGIVSDNVATHTGGGIYNNGTTMVDDSTINDNMADFNGGGIYNNDILHVQNGSAIGGIGEPNTANKGGGIFNENGTTTLNGSTVSDNDANTSGGGIYNRATLDIQTGSLISSNDALGTDLDQGGGGIYNDDDSMIAVNGSIISGNQASSDGGGIYLRATMATVDNCTVSGNSASGGGGFYVLGSDLSLDDSVIISNTATGAGGGIFNDAGTITLNGGMVRENTAAYGGGIYNGYYTTTVTGSRLLYNTATTNGGAVYNNEEIAEATRVTGSCIVGNREIAFYNNQPWEQIATGNWWGAATGPSTSGADSVLGLVDISGYLSEPILDCTPELQVGKTNDTGGQVTVGSPFHWTLTISNTGLLDASFEAGQVILRDNLPAGPSYSVPAVNNLVDITNSASIACTITENTLTCEALAGGVTIGSVTGSFEVSFSVTSNTPGTLVNPNGICRVDPDDHVDEGDEDNSCPADFVEITAPNLYLPLVQK